MVLSTKLITIREAANRLGSKESNDQEIHPETADRLCEAVGARHYGFPSKNSNGFCLPASTCHPSSGRCPMSRWKEFRREPVAGEWTRKQKRGYHRVRWSLLGSGNATSSRCSGSRSPRQKGRGCGVDLPS